MEDRRRMPRVPFLAMCELLEVKTGLRLNDAQVSQLSLHGCYVETVNPLANDTEVYVKVFSDEHFFESPARVVYCNVGQGMGLEFHDVKPHFIGVLQNWLAAPAKDRG